MRYSWTMRGTTWIVMFVVCFISAFQSTMVEAQDGVDEARGLYNAGRFDDAIAEARSVSQQSRANAAAVILARAQLERFRLVGDRSDLDAARTLLRDLDARDLSATERVDWELGVATALYLQGDFGPAAEILDRLLRADMVGADDRDRLVDWWASAIDQTARGLDVERRTHVYGRVLDRLESERARNPESSATTYWLVAAARGAGDVERAWALGVAGWILAGGANGVLRTDLDRLVLQGVIPDLAALRTTRPHSDDITIWTMAQMASDWESMKSSWDSP